MLCHDLKVQQGTLKLGFVYLPDHQEPVVWQGMVTKVITKIIRRPFLVTDHMGAVFKLKALLQQHFAAGAEDLFRLW